MKKCSPESAFPTIQTKYHERAGGTWAKDPRDNFQARRLRSNCHCGANEIKRQALHRKARNTTLHNNAGSVRRFLGCPPRRIRKSYWAPSLDYVQVRDDNPDLENRWSVEMFLGSGTRCDLMSHLARDDNPYISTRAKYGSRNTQNQTHAPTQKHATRRQRNMH